MAYTYSQIGSRVKAKYPKTYDHLDDYELGRKTVEANRDKFADAVDDKQAQVDTASAAPDTTAAQPRPTVAPKGESFTYTQIGQRVKKKYPGKYDTEDDYSVGRKVVNTNRDTFPDAVDDKGMIYNWKNKRGPRAAAAIMGAPYESPSGDLTINQPSNMWTAAELLGAAGGIVTDNLTATGLKIKDAYQALPAPVRGAVSGGVGAVAKPLGSLLAPVGDAIKNGVSAGAQVFKEEAGPLWPVYKAIGQEGMDALNLLIGGPGTAKAAKTASNWITKAAAAEAGPLVPEAAAALKLADEPALNVANMSMGDVKGKLTGSVVDAAGQTVDIGKVPKQRRWFFWSDLDEAERRIIAEPKAPETIPLSEYAKQSLVNKANMQAKSPLVVAARNGTKALRYVDVMRRNIGKQLDDLLASATSARVVIDKAPARDLLAKRLNSIVGTGDDIISKSARDAGDELIAHIDALPDQLTPESAQKLKRYLAKQTKWDAAGQMRPPNTELDGIVKVVVNEIDNALAKSIDGYSDVNTAYGKVASVENLLSKHLGPDVAKSDVGTKAAQMMKRAIESNGDTGAAELFRAIKEITGGRFNLFQDAAYASIVMKRSGDVKQVAKATYGLPVREVIGGIPGAMMTEGSNIVKHKTNAGALSRIAKWSERQQSRAGTTTLSQVASDLPSVAKATEGYTLRGAGMTAQEELAQRMRRGIARRGKIQGAVSAEEKARLAELDRRAAEAAAARSVAAGKGRRGAEEVRGRLQGRIESRTGIQEALAQNAEAQRLADLRRQAGQASRERPEGVSPTAYFHRLHAGGQAEYSGPGLNNMANRAGLGALGGYMAPVDERGKTPEEVSRLRLRNALVAASASAVIPSVARSFGLSPKSAGVANAMGIVLKDKNGRFLRAEGATKGRDIVADVSKSKAPLISEWDTAENWNDAVKRANSMVYLTPDVTDELFSMRYRGKEGEILGNDKMKFANAAYQLGRTTHEKQGCGRAAFCQKNGLPGEACYSTEGKKGRACYAEDQTKRKQGTVASVAGGISVKPLRDDVLRNEIDKYYKKNGMESTQAYWPQYQIKWNADKERLSISIVSEPRGAIVSTNLEPLNGKDVRYGVDTDGSAWLSRPEVMDAILKSNPGIVSVYSSGYYAPPARHALAGRTVINVTVSGWHPLPETLSRLRWAKEARDNGWNVILREVVADPKTFPKDAAKYNRIHKMIQDTDFYIMSQPLHVGKTHGTALKLGEPSCCVGTAKNPHKCAECQTSEGLGLGFKKYWGMNDDAAILRDFPDFRKNQKTWTKAKEAENTAASSTTASELTGGSQEYPKATGSVSGLSVDKDVPNMSSIASTFNEGEYRILSGVREIPIKEFNSAPRELFYAADDLDRVRKLAKDISNSKTTKPLIVVIDDEGPYVLEGGHRLGALHEAGAKSVPAVVVDVRKAKSPAKTRGTTASEIVKKR